MHADLLAQAEALATMDAKKPRQVNLRRAVSSAYYGIFHFLVTEACCAQFGAQHAQTPYRNVIARAFSHTVMKAACTAFGGGTLKDTVIKGLPRNPAGRYEIEPEIQKISRRFVALQEKRHFADYDRSEQFKRSDVLELIEVTKDRIEKFSALPMSDGKRFFLTCLWAWKELVNR